MDKIFSDYLETIDAVIEKGPYKDTWESLCRYEIPKWFRQAKLGIFIHWGIYAVPAYHEWYAKYMYDNGFNILMIEQRAHNLSKAKYTSFGYYESFDLQKWINKIIEYDPLSKIAVFGFSMGAATCLNIASFNLPKNVKCLIADSAYSSTKEILKYSISKKFHSSIAIHFIYFSILFQCFLHKIPISKIYPKKSLKSSKLPVLLIHGTIDKIVPFYMLDENYNSINENIFKSKLILQNAYHGMGIIVSEKKYKEFLISFINKFIY